MKKKLLCLVALLVAVLSYSQIANKPNDYIICDTDDDGFAQFDFDTVITPQVLGTQDPQDLVLTYYASLNDFNNNINPIANTSNYTNTYRYQTIYVRLENTSMGTFATTSFIILAEIKPIFNTNLVAEICGDSTVFGKNINAVEYNGAITNDNADFLYTYTYYETQEDADADINAIADPSNYNNFNNLFVFYLRATSKFLGCYYETTSFELHEYVPYLNNTDALELCGTTDTATFNLELNHVLNETTDQVVTYHASSSDAYNNINALPFNYQNTINPQTIYIRATLNDSPSGIITDCYDVKPLDLVVNTGTPVTANVIGDIAICGSELNYDLTQNEAAITGGQTGTTISYYNSLEYLLQSFEPITNPNNVTLNEFGTNTYYVRVNADASNCFNTTEINVTVQSDLALDAASLNNCDNSLDYDLQLAISQINNAFDSNITFHLTEADGLSNSNAIANINTYTASSNNQTLFSRGLISDTCYGVGTVELISNNTPTANTIPTQNLCGFPQEHDITIIESAIIGSQTDVSISYFTTLADLQSNLNPITNATTFNFDNAGTYTFYVRVDSDLTDCYSYVEIEFLVGDNFDTYDTYLSKCDDDFDGISTFNLEEALQYITIETGLTMTFFESIEDAQVNTNVITNPENYTNTTPDVQVVYARAEHISGCVNIQQLYLLVSAIEPVTSVSSLDTCDDNYNDGFAEFTLSDIQNEVLGNNLTGDFFVTYFENLTDAENYTNQLPVTYTNTTANQQTIYARTEWQYDIDCYYVVPVELNVISTPATTIRSNLQLFGCDENNDGIVVFHLDSIVDDILNGTPDTEIKFYRILAESLDESNALTSPYYTPGTIWAKATNSSGCATAVQLELVVEDCPEFVTCGTTVNTTYCYTENDTTEFRFKSTDGSPLVVVFNAGQIEYGYDVLNVIDSDGATNLNTVTPWGNVNAGGDVGDVSGLNFTSSGDRLTIIINSDDIISCSDEGYTSLDFDVLCASNVGYIQVNAFLDENNDGIFNGIDTPFTNGFSTYEVNNDGNIITVNSNTESYTIANLDEANSYDITYEVYPDYENCFNIPTALVENISVLHGNTINVNFPITEAMPCEDLAVYLVPVDSPRPGFDTWCELRLENVGSSEITTGTVTFQHDALVNYVSSNSIGTGLTITPTGTGVTIDFTNLLPEETKTVMVLLHTPTSVSLGELVTHNLEYTTASNDIITANNTSTVTLEVIGSYDPNDIIESHGREIVYDDFITSDEYLYYTIRFQNVGTAEAITVRIENTINALLDISTMQMLSSSHDYVMVQNGNQLTWTFDNINLPAQSQDDLGSNGYVYLKIKPTAGYNVGTLIPDSAEIYFDFNAPVITNTFITEYVNTLSVSQFNTNTFSLYPNPVKEAVNIKLNSALSGNVFVEIVDVQGKIILQDRLSKTLQINVLNFEPGLYFVKLKHDHGEFIKKLIIKK
ncbi:T9SS type A sorting domain-containing protein [uncultured Algibacter sp.]|uniref:T9SS type A sorting domain-containing protein n=1 Tax=uncultured Algibacter sp. TaxID=298659 RepID=UPI002636424E|nr:T9SS type A sorting domain-containing protein [uncultured Algibacter sp.]